MDIKEQLTPPHGVWINTKSIGPPLFRFLCLQAMYTTIVKQKRLSSFRKVILMTLTLIGVLIFDYQIYMNKYYEGTIYEKLRVNRSASPDQIDAALESYSACLESFNRNPRAVKAHALCSGQKYFTDKMRQDISDMVHDPKLRDYYDKQEVFVQTSTQDVHPTLLDMYDIIFKSIRGAYMIWPFILFCGFHHPYQVVIRRTVLTCVTIFAGIVAYLEMPRDGKNENMLIQFINSISVFDEYTYFQLSFFFKDLFMPALFPYFVQLSKMFDVPHETIYDDIMKEVRLDMSKMVLMLECAKTTDVTTPQKDHDNQQTPQGDHEQFEKYQQAIQTCNKGYVEYSNKGLASFRIESEKQKKIYRKTMFKKAFVILLLVGYLAFNYGEQAMVQYNQYQEEKLRLKEERKAKKESFHEITIETLIEGKDDGARPEEGMIAIYHYNLYQPNGQQFGSTYENGQPETKKIGNPKQVMCLDEALRQMTRGQKVRLICPANKMVFLSGEKIQEDAKPKAAIYELELGDFITQEEFQRRQQMGMAQMKKQLEIARQKKEEAARIKKILDGDGDEEDDQPDDQQSDQQQPPVANEQA